MAKKVAGQLKLQVPAGQANPSPPVGPALGQRGLNVPPDSQAVPENFGKDAVGRRVGLVKGESSRERRDFLRGHAVEQRRAFRVEEAGRLTDAPGCQEMIHALPTLPGIRGPEERSCRTGVELPAAAR